MAATGEAFHILQLYTVAVFVTGDRQYVRHTQCLSIWLAEVAPSYVTGVPTA